MVRCRPPATTSASCSGWRRWPTGSSGGFAAPNGRCRRRLPWRCASYAYAHFAGTPYQAAKATVIAAPLAMLIAARSLLSPEQIVELGAIRGAGRPHPNGPVRRPLTLATPLKAVLATLFWRRRGGLLGVGARERAGRPVDLHAGAHRAAPRAAERVDPRLVPEHVLADEHGRDYVVWELRGGRVCVKAACGAGPSTRPARGRARDHPGSDRRLRIAGLRLERAAVRTRSGRAIRLPRATARVR